MTSEGVISSIWSGTPLIVPDTLTTPPAHNLHLLLITYTSGSRWGSCWPGSASWGPSARCWSPCRWRPACWRRGPAPPAGMGSTCYMGTSWREFERCGYETGSPATTAHRRDFMIARFFPTAILVGRMWQYYPKSALGGYQNEGDFGIIDLTDTLHVTAITS